MILLFKYFGTKEPVIGKKKPKYTQANLLPYIVFKEKNYSYSTIRRFAIYLELDVQKPPSEDQLEKIARFEWKDYKYKSDEFTVFFYLKGMDRQIMAYASAILNEHGLKDLNILGR